MITGITLIGALPFMGLVCSYCEKNRQTEPTFTHTNRISKTKIPKFVIRLHLPITPYCVKFIFII